MKISSSIAIAAFVLAMQVSALAAEIAVLRNGFSIRCERREQMGGAVRLYTANGYIDVPAGEITSFEKEEIPVVVVPPPVAATAPKPAPVSPASVTSAPQLPPLATKPAPVDIQQLVRDASARNRLDPDFVNSVIKAESDFYPGARSPKGALGLMQLMPSTAALLGVADPFDPKSNVDAGTAHLSQLLDMYHDDPIKALAAYNAGAKRVEQYHGVPPYRETHAYVARIIRDFNAKKLAQKKAAPSLPAKSKSQSTSTGTSRIGSQTN